MKQNRLRSQKPGKTREKAGKMIAIRKNRIIFLAALVVFLIVLVSGSRYISSFQALQNEESWALSLREAPKEQGTNYLLIGGMTDDHIYQVEEILFLNYPEPGSKPHVLYIPGRMLLHRQEEDAVGETGAGTPPVNKNGEDAKLPEDGEEVDMPGDSDSTPGSSVQSYYTPTHFYNEGGTELLIDQLRLLLGADIHHYIKLDYQGIAGLVDEAGGIPYHDHVLAGSEFLESFLREEEEEEPRQRAMQRAETIKNLVGMLGEKGGVFATPSMLREAAPYVETDLEWKEMEQFYDQYSLIFDPETLALSLPGQWNDFNGESYFQLEHSLLTRIIDNLGSEFIIPREMITVEVLNGSGVSGIAGQTAEYLREEGFQVVDVDNADHQDYQRSNVISRIDDIEAAREVALLIPGAEFFKEPIQDHPAMVTVIVGRNFDL